MTKPKDGEGAEEAIARIIDPAAFKLRKFVDKRHPNVFNPSQLGWQMVALAKARAILALAPPATPVRGGGNQGLSVSQSQPGYDGERAASASAEPSAAEALPANQQEDAHG